MNRANLAKNHESSSDAPGLLSQAPTRPAKRSVLLEPTFGYRSSADPKPTLRELFIEWLDAIAFWRDRTRLLIASNALIQWGVLVAFAVYVAFFWSVSRSWAIAAIGVAVGVVYNTFWYHRYCTHHAFRFRNLWWARVFLWTNPASFREESYVIPHHIHHTHSDETLDPHGPHFGWLGSYLANESQQKINPQIAREDFDRLAGSLRHIGFKMNSYEQFQRTAEFENAGHYFARLAFANLFWSTLAFSVAGWVGVLVWYAAIGAYTFIVRDFNFHGHGGFFLPRLNSAPINHPLYGFVAGEWHRNHHEHPASARSGVAWWQLDMPYLVVRALKSVGIISRFNPLRESETPPK